jgi:hypothetical protein
MYTYKDTDHYSSHAQILDWIANVRSKTVLEIGPASGYLSRAMRAHGCSVTAIECDATVADATSCDRLIIGDVQTVDLSGLSAFDAIVIGDVLEHLPDPLATLTRLVPLVRSFGYVLVSVPNVAHLWIRLQMLCGRFDYTDRGILDRTHLRFFTRRTARQLMTDAGLIVLTVQPTPVPLPLLWPATGRGGRLAALHWLHHQITRLWPTLFAYQFVLVCRRRLPMEG